MTLVLIGGGSWYRLHQLKQGGGRAVADMLGGKRIVSATDDPLLRRLLNVVEEMAIASGLPVPPVYLLEQQGINAFAAGFAPADAVIAVTRGAVELLGRDGLQGVIAHEFSHILNGDTRLKMRLMGMLFGVTLISDAGILMLSSRHNMAYSSRQRGTHPALLAIGFLLFLVGTIGAVFADLIKRAVSRQREFLADAAAVQFTRNPSGLAGALKLIGGYGNGSRVSHSATRQASHFFFAEAGKKGTIDWWSTHPPLIERIRRLDPHFNAVFEQVSAADLIRRNLETAATDALVSTAHQPSAMTGITTARIMDAIGQPVPDTANALLAMIPDRLRRFARDPYTARAIVYGMLLDMDRTMRTQQLDALQQQADAAVFSELLDMYPLLARLDISSRIPLLELAMPALKELSSLQYKQFIKNVRLLINANHQLSMFEYMLHRMLLASLRPAFEPQQKTPVNRDASAAVYEDLAVVVAMLARLGRHVSPATVFRQAMVQTGVDRDVNMPDKGQCSMHRLDAALNHLQTTAPALRRQIVVACAKAVLADGFVAVSEMELLRALCSALDCPLPPLETGH